MKFVKILIFVGVAAIAMAATTPRAYALDAGLTAGLFMPTGDAADVYDYDMGYAIKAHVSSGLLPLIDYRIFAGYYQASIDEELNNGSAVGDLTSTHGGLMLVFSPPTPVVSAYVGVGYAVHKTKYGVDGSDWGHGIVAEAGVGMSLVLAEFGLYANYMDNKLGLFDKDGDEGLKMGGYSIGLYGRVGF